MLRRATKALLLTIWIVSLVILGACQSKSVVTPISASASQPLIIETRASTETKEISSQTTSTLTSNAPSLVTKTTTNVGLTRSCANYSGGLETLNSGRLLFRSDAKIWVLDAKDSQPQILFDKDPGLKVSPYTGALMWMSNTTIEYQSPNGLRVSLPRPEHPTVFVQWLHNDRVLLRALVPDDFVGLLPAIDTLYEVDFSSGQITAHTLKMLGSFARGLTLNYYRALPTYDPSFKVAIYGLRGEQEFRDDGMLLWDIAAQEVLWQKRWFWPIERTGYDWSLDDNYLVISGPANELRSSPELIRIALDGTSEQLSNLRESLKDYSDYQILEVKLSSNGRYVAFVALTDERRPLDERYLYLFDTTTAEIIDVCVPLVQGSLDLFWSPDSKQIAFTTDANRSLMILDIEAVQTQKVSLDEGEQVFAIYGWTK